jgi:hypothetical protein
VERNRTTTCLSGARHWTENHGGGGRGGEGLFLSLLLWNSSDPVWHMTPTTVHSTVLYICVETALQKYRNIEQSNKADIKDWEKAKATT